MNALTTARAEPVAVKGVHQKGHSPAHARVGIEGDFVAVVVDQADGQPGA